MDLNIKNYSPATFKGETLNRRDLVLNRLPRGKVILLAGAGDVGKSFLLLQLFEAINAPTTKQYGGFEVMGSEVVGSEMPCVLLMGEDDFEAIDLRLKAIRGQSGRAPQEHGAILPIPNIGAFQLVKRDWDGSIVPTDKLEWLERNLEAFRATHGKLGFLGIDTFSSLLPVDANKPEEVQAVLSILSALAARQDIAIVVTHHLRKGDAGSTKDELRAAIRGSTAIVDGVRAAYVMRRYDENEAAAIRAETNMAYDGDIVELRLVKNNLGLYAAPIIYARMPDGVLMDISRLMSQRMTPQEALLSIIREANEKGHKIMKTGANGIYANQLSGWPGGLGGWSRQKLEKLVVGLEAKGLLRADKSGLFVVNDQGTAAIMA